jgi:RNA polymerase sigma factor (sigma-70 family)
MDGEDMSALAVVTRPADQSTDDLDLVAAVRAGDGRAFELLFARYQSRIAAYVRGMVRDHGRAEDITQEVFISALRRMRATEREIDFKPWIYEIAKNACIDAFRRSRCTSEVSFDAEDALGPADQRHLVAVGSAPESVIDTKLAIDNLCGAMGGLSQTHHDILVMREFEGLSYGEIGERLGMSRAGVESTLFRARRRLGEEYEELVSGERCVRVRAIVDAPAGRAAGLRDRRRVARHISHCQPCRRYALRAGVEVGAMRVPASVGARIAALLPLPAFPRRRVDDAGQVLGMHGMPTLKVLSTLDPSTVSGWSKAVATAATVAVAGLGAGAAVHRDTFAAFVSSAPGLVGLSSELPAAKAPSSSSVRSLAAAVARPSVAAGTVEPARWATRRSGGADDPLQRQDAGTSPAAPDGSSAGGSSEGRSSAGGAVAALGAAGAVGGVGRVLRARVASRIGGALGTTSVVEPPPGHKRGRGLGGLLGAGGAGGAGADATAGSRPSLGDGVSTVVESLRGAAGTGAAGSGTGAGDAIAGSASVGGGGANAATSSPTGASPPSTQVGGVVSAVVGQLGATGSS